MKYRALGRTGMDVAEVSFGAWAIGGSWGEVDDKESLAALHKAVTKLKSVLRPLGMAPVLETREITSADFMANPVASNRIWIAGESLETWLGASTGSSVCCSACGGAECRTVDLPGQSYEAIPENLILQAALLAAAREVGAAQPAGQPAAGATSCC